MYDDLTQSFCEFEQKKIALCQNLRKHYGKYMQELFASKKDYIYDCANQSVVKNEDCFDELGFIYIEIDNIYVEVTDYGIPRCFSVFKVLGPHGVENIISRDFGIKDFYFLDAHEIDELLPDTADFPSIAADILCATGNSRIYWNMLTMEVTIQ